MSAVKSGRQDAIKKIISENEIETQNQLLEELDKIGIRTTQATLSRDIKSLQLIFGIGFDFRKICNVQISNEINHLFTIAAACSAFDNMNVEKLAGTIAGDDTAFLLFKDTDSADDFLHKINSIL